MLLKDVGVEQAWMAEPAAGRYGRSESPFDSQDHREQRDQHEDDYHPE